MSKLLWDISIKDDNSFIVYGLAQKVELYYCRALLKLFGRISKPFIFTKYERNLRWKYYINTTKQ